MAKIKVEGLDKLQKALKENVSMDLVKRVVRDNGYELQGKIVENADFKMGYQTGETKRSVELAGVAIVDGGFTAEAGATTDYAPYLEHGTRFMEAQPFVKPAFDEQNKQFQKDMKRLVK
jgi:HK97 gp10 family phage protein